MRGSASLTLTAAVVLLCCWYSVSGDYTFDGQRTALDIAILSVVTVNIGGATVVIAGRRAVGLRRRTLLMDVPLVPRTAPGDVRTSDLVPVVLIGGAGLRHYHRMDCQMGAGRAWTEAPRRTHEKEGRAPCGVCRP